MKRREALKNVSLFISGTLAIPTGSILLNSCSNPSKELGWNPKYLNNEEAFFLSELANTIIPNTEFPGALAVGGAALIGKSKLKARQNRRNETQAAAANQRLVDDEAKVKAKKEAEDNKKVSGAKPVQQQKPNAMENNFKCKHIFG